jgi:hypothetical protein
LKQLEAQEGQGPRSLKDYVRPLLLKLVGVRDLFVNLRPRPIPARRTKCGSERYRKR